MRDLKKMLVQSQAVYIVGDRSIRELVRYVIQQDMPEKVQAWLVDRRPAPPRKVSGLPLLFMGDYNYTEGDVIIVAAFGHILEDACHNLERFGIYDYYVITLEDFQNLQECLLTEKTQRAEFKRLFSAALRMCKDVEDVLLLLDEKQAQLWQCMTHPPISVAKYDEELSALNNTDKGTIVCLTMECKVLQNDMLEKLCNTGKEIVLYTWKLYLEMQGDEDFFARIKKKDYQMSECATVYHTNREVDLESKLIRLVPRGVNSLYEDKLCTGCGVCTLLCPYGALALKRDEYGYERPIVIDESKCIHCGKCVASCPVYHVKTDEKADEVICLAYMGSDEVREASSSGGAFGTIAKAWLDKGGVVCGAAWNSDFSVEHIIIDDLQNLSLLQRSKYVKSDCTDILPQIETLLKNGTQVLFSGAPCQVAALKKYLKKDYDNLLIIDILCNCAPATSLFQKALSENYNVNDLCEVGFREKSMGWVFDSFFVRDSQGRITVKRADDTYISAFSVGFVKPLHCEYCEFATIPRQADVTMGDFWGIKYYDSTLDDGKGTSVVLLNTSKGRTCRDLLDREAKICREVPVSWAAGNRLFRYHNPAPHRNRDRFINEVIRAPFKRSVAHCMENTFDIGLVGLWGNYNYGSALTYYALYRVLRAMGYSVLLIEWPEDSDMKPFAFAQRFEIEPYESYEIAPPARSREDMFRYNAMCDMIVHGSDQVMSSTILQGMQDNPLLKWSNSQKRTIGCAFSFGHEKLEITKEKQEEIQVYLKRYDAISVRESSGTAIMKEMFGIVAQHVLDPVFWCDKTAYMHLAGRYLKDKAYVLECFSYMLYPSEEKVRAVKHVADAMDCSFSIVGDGALQEMQDRYEVKIQVGKSVEKWLADLMQSRFVVTDSFHGTCFAILFRKDFITIGNAQYGLARFTSLLEQLGLRERLVLNAQEVIGNTRLLEPIDYDAVEQKLEPLREEALTWLRNALTAPEKKEPTLESLNDRCNYLEQMIQELLKKIANNKE